VRAFSVRSAPQLPALLRVLVAQGETVRTPLRTPPSRHRAAAHTRACVF
jgi:hypothetical protein